MEPAAQSDRPGQSADIRAEDEFLIALRLSSRWRWPGLVYVCVVVATIGTFVAGSLVASNVLFDAQRTRQIEELAETALRRAEVSVDFGAATLDELIERGPMACDAVALQTVRLHVYQRGNVKDIRAVNRDGSVICSAYSETLEFDKGWAGRDAMLPARDQSVRLFLVEQFFGIALGVLKDVDADRSLVAVLGMNPSLYDIMPTELRPHSEVALELGDGQTVARYAFTETETFGEDAVGFVRISERYPLRVVLKVEPKAYGRWHQEPYLPIVVFAAVMGLAFGLLLANTVNRPRNPVDQMDQALAAGEFQPYLQPVFDLRSGTIIGCEALARWLRPDGSIIPPLRFIPFAESNDRIGPLTWHIVSAALEALRVPLRRDGNFKVAVNISPCHLISDGFEQRFREVVAEADVPPRQVVLELTEREELPDPAKVAAVIESLRRWGFGVALDDMGIGHNGLSHIQQLGANIIKIDKFFVDGIGLDASATTVVEMLVSLARQLNMSVLAEGIETETQLDGLVACGVTEGQGYLRAVPLPVDGFLTLLEESCASATPEPMAPPRVHVA